MKRVIIENAVPDEMRLELDKARILITNVHASQLRERSDAGKLTRGILAEGGTSAFTATRDQMVRRVYGGLGNKTGSRQS